MKKSLSVYAFGHFAVDLLCAWLLFGRISGTSNWLELALVYNFCAFALQMPIGILADHWSATRTFSLLGIGLTLLALIPLNDWWCVILAGLGNALYHVGGGRHTLLSSGGYRQLGIFVAPGALGIFLGSCFRESQPVGIIAAALLALCAVALLLCCPACVKSAEARFSPAPGTLWRLIGLFLVVFLRSLVGMTMAAPWKQGLWVALGAVMGCAGKLLGGIAANRFGGKLTGGASLLLSAVLFLFPGCSICGVLALLLFQMSMPITLGDCARLLRGSEGFAFGLLTFALFLGFLPAQYGLTLSAGLAALLAALSSIGILLAAGRDAP